MKVHDRLLEVLSRARVRWILYAMVTAAAVPAIVGSGIAIVVLMADHPLLIRWWQVSLLLLAFAAALAFRLRSVPSLVALAHRVDRRGDGTSTIGTAVELAVDGLRPLTLVEQAAIEDAVVRTRDLRAGDVAPFRPPRWLWTAPIALGFAFAFSIIHPTDAPRASFEPTNEARDDGGDPQRDTLTTSRDAVRRVAEMLGREEVVQDDEYLRAVASGFEELTQRLDDPETSDADVRAELDPLLDHLARAVASRHDVFGTLLRDLATSRLETPPSSDAGTATPEDAVGNEEIGDMVMDLGAPRRAKDIDDLLDALDEAVAGASDRRPRERPDGLEPEGFYGGIFDDDGAQRSASGNLREGDAAGQAVGAAERSNERAGDAAGDGSQNGDPDSPGDAFAAIEVDVESVNLSDAHEDLSGARVEGDGFSEGRSSGAATRIETDDDGPPALRAREASVAQEAIGTRYHSVVERYFLPHTMGATTP